MNLQLLTAPAAYPVSMAELKAHLRIDGADEDPVLATYLSTATKVVEDLSGRATLARTYRLFLDAWPCPMPKVWEVRLPMPPLVSVTHIKTYDDADAASTVPSSTYFVDAVAGRLFPRQGFAWPMPTRVASGIEIEFQAGHAAAGDVPENLRTAILWLAAHYHRHREPVVTGTIATTLPLGVETLIAQSRSWT